MDDWPLILCFLLINLAPIGVSPWVAGKHLINRRFRSAAVYGSPPLIAVGLAFASARAGDEAVLEVRLWQYSEKLAFTQQTKTVVSTNTTWIDPGPPTRACFFTDGSVLAAFYIVFSAETDHDWLDAQAPECGSKPIPLRRNFCSIAGQC